jgi:hypothetical protein
MKELNIDEILSERGKSYGPFAGHARITQAIKAAMYTAPRWDSLNVVQKEALEMVAHKIGRILNGDPNYLDSWDDAIGYLTLVTKDLRT